MAIFFFKNEKSIWKRHTEAVHVNLVFFKRIFASTNNNIVGFFGDTCQIGT